MTDFDVSKFMFVRTFTFGALGSPNLPFCSSSFAYFHPRAEESGASLAL
jgi:hypothetical protein